MSDETHDRTKFIGGSDIAAIIGVSPWATAVDVWERKTGIAPKEELSPAKRKLFKRGHRWESVVAEMLSETLVGDGHEVEIVGSNARYTDEQITYFASEIDYELRLDGSESVTNAELKTVHPFASKDWGDSEDETPDYYTAQVQWGLGITNRPTAILAALFGADYLKTYEIVRDDDVIEWMRDAAEKFWTDHVLTGIPPEPKTLGDLAKLHPSDDGGEILANDDLLDKWLRLRAIKDEIKARESEGDALEFAIKRAMGPNQVLRSEAFGCPVVTWKDRKSTRLDQSKLKEEEPKIHRKYTKSSVSRTFIVKNPKK